MPIRKHLTDKTAFGPAAIEAMSKAFEEACVALQVYAGDEKGRGIIATRIIDLARRGGSIQQHSEIASSLRRDLANNYPAGEVDTHLVVGGGGGWAGLRRPSGGLSPALDFEVCAVLWAALRFRGLELFRFED